MLDKLGVRMPRVSVSLPAGMRAGQQLRVEYGGTMYEVTIPAGVAPGSAFEIEVGSAPVPVAVAAQPVAQPGLVMCTAVVPPGAVAGQSVPVVGPNGAQLMVPLPPGLQPGQQFQFQAAATPPMAHAAPVAHAAPPPAQRQPSAPVPMGQPVDATALKHAECPISFEPLHAGPLGVFLNPQGRRVSRHFFNLDAAREWLRSGSGICPLTRQPVASVLAVPDIRSDPEGWFRAGPLTLKPTPNPNSQP